jgi:hypothetical protein
LINFSLFLIAVFLGDTFGRGNAADLLKLFVEMPLVVITAAFRCFGYAIITAPEHHFRVSDAGPDEVPVHGHTGFLPEKYAKIGGVKSAYGCHLPHGNLFLVMAGDIVDGLFDTDIFQRGRSRIEKDFKEAVKDEQKESPGFKGIEGMTVGPDINQFMKEMDKVVVDTDVVNKGKREPAVFLFLAFKDKLDRETAHKLAGVGNGSSYMTRREAEEVPRGKVIGRTVDSIAGDTFGKVSNAPERKNVFLDTPHRGGLTEDAVIYLGEDRLVYFTGTRYLKKTGFLRE